MNKRETCYLMKKTGQYVKVQMVNNERKLCIVELTRPATSDTVIIQQRPSKAGNDIEMAFVFPHYSKKVDDNSVIVNHYSPKVEGNSMKLEQSDSNSELPDSHWFKRINKEGGDIYRLESVISPGLFISIKQYSRPITLGLSKKDFVRVTHNAAN